MKLGIDFGTTNSAVAVLLPDGTPRTLQLAPDEPVQRTVIHGSPTGVVTFGNAAFKAYLAHDLEGRFLRSIKAFLPQDVPRTALCGRLVSFPELITAYLRFLMERAQLVLDAPVTEVTVGRPVRFHLDPDKDAAAVQRLTQAVEAAGIENWKLQLEPVAAAYRYERELTRNRVVLVGDFGGGTSDFAILEVGPGRTGDRLEDVLATTGVAKAGDVLDGRFLDTFLMSWFGRGSRFTPRYETESQRWNHPIQRQLQQLYKLHMLRSNDLARRLDYVETRIDDVRVIRRIRRLIFDDLGYPMAWAIEASKRALSMADSAVFRFEEFYSDSLDFEQRVHLAQFATGCQPVLADYRTAIDEALGLAGLTAAGIDDVFLTGGTAQLPFIQDLFADKFGRERLRSANAFTSVCEGLALS
jgi:hypothetical chaperone protein